MRGVTPKAVTENLHAPGAWDCRPGGGTAARPRLRRNTGQPQRPPRTPSSGTISSTAQSGLIGEFATCPAPVC